MKKKLENIYDYDDYRIILVDDFLKRNKENPKFSLRSYALSLKISAGFLSKVFHHKKHFDPNKGKMIFAQLGFDERELSFVEDLIRLNTATDFFQRQEILEKIRSLYPQKMTIKSKNGSNPILSSTTHFVIYGLVRKLNSKIALFGITDQIGILRSDVEDSLRFLKKNKFIRIRKDYIYLSQQEFQTIKDHDKFCLFGKDLALFFYEHYVQQNISRVPDNTASTLILGFDATSIREVHDLNKHYILSLIKISERTKNPTILSFLNHLYMEKALSLGLKSEGIGLAQSNDLDRTPF